MPDLKQIATHFWDAAMKHAWEQEFGSPKNAKSFDEVWKEWKATKPKLKMIISLEED